MKAPEFLQTLVSDTASICERRGCLCLFSGAFFCPQHAREGTCARARSTSPDCFQMKMVGLLLMLREEVLAEIIRPVGYSNVVRLCLQVAFPTLLRNRFQFLSALHTQSCFVCRLSFHYISRLPSQNDPPTIRFGADRHSCKQLRRW